MKTPPRNNSHLWNDLSSEERMRLMPQVMEAQILHIWQCKQKAIKAHQAHMKDLDQWMDSINKDLK